MLLPHRFDPRTITRPHLVTIPYSHYCEVGRWALQRGGIDFVEAKYAPGYHARVVGQLRRDRSNRSETSYVGQESGTHGGRRKYSVPLVCLPGGRVLRDSWEILEYAVGGPDPHWQTRMDRELGVAVRQIAYHYILTPEGESLLRGMLAQASVVERALFWVFGREVRRQMRQLMAITEENVQASQAQVLALLEDAGQALREHGGALQAGGGFGPTELAFCGLAAICTVPEDYGAGAVDMPPLDAYPARFRAFVDACRDTEAGRWVLDCYRTHRIGPGPGVRA